MQNKLWYNVVVPTGFEKKDQPLALRVPQSLLDELARIGAKEDRPLGYVARELMVRGLRLYKQDGFVRDDPVREYKLAKVRHEGELTDEIQTRNAGSKTKTRRAGKAKTAK